MKCNDQMVALYRLCHTVWLVQVSIHTLKALIQLFE